MNRFQQLCIGIQGFTFDILIPTPPELLKVCTGFNQGMTSWTESTIDGKYVTTAVDEAAMIEKYGYISWHHFSLGEWGCKWDAESCLVLVGREDQELNITFNTPWSTPNKFYQYNIGHKPTYDLYYSGGFAYQVLARTFPDAVIVIDWMHEGENGGQYLLENGEMIEVLSFDAPEFETFEALHNGLEMSYYKCIKSDNPNVTIGDYYIGGTSWAFRKIFSDIGAVYKFLAKYIGIDVSLVPSLITKVDSAFI